MPSCKCSVCLRPEQGWLQPSPGETGKALLDSIARVKIKRQEQAVGSCPEVLSMKFCLSVV